MADPLPMTTVAPALTDEKLVTYKDLINSLDPKSHLSNILKSLLTCVEKWWSLPESSQQPKVYFGGASQSLDGKKIELIEIPLEKAHSEQLYDLIAWDAELEMYKTVIETLPTGTVESALEPITLSDGSVRMVSKVKVVDQKAYDLRNAALHLLWHTIELSKGREPMTLDKVKVLE